MLKLNGSHFLLSVAAWGGMLQFGFCLDAAMQVYGGGSEEAPESVGYVVMQKVTAGLAMFWFLAIASPVSPVYRTAVRYISEQRLLAERQAVKYMARLERGYRLLCDPPR